MTEETWKFVNTFAPWFSAIGTISAVVLSLFLARRDKRIRLQVNAGHRLIVSQGVHAPHPEYLYIGVVNVGHREAQITNIGWKIGLFKKQLAVQTTLSDGMSSSIPVRLKDGEEAKFFIPLNGNNDWLNSFAKDMFQGRFPRLRARWVRIEAYTSLGSTFGSFIEKGLRVKLLDAIDEQRKKAGAT